MIQTFKTGGKGGANCDLFINCPLPPDFQSFWTQASQQNYNPKLATVAKVMLFPTDAYALGEPVEQRGDRRVVHAVLALQVVIDGPERERLLRRLPGGRARPVGSVHGFDVLAVRDRHRGV